MTSTPVSTSTSAPALIAVIGPVEPDLLRAFHAHYRALGVAEFRLAFHFTAAADPAAVDALLGVCEELIGPPRIVSRGPWHETLHSRLRDRLRAAAAADTGPGWHLIADSDEFQVHPVPPADQIAAAEADGRRVVGGVLLDRVTTDGRLTGWTPDPAAGPVGGLDAAYPLGGFLTHRLLHGDPRKIVLAHSSVPLALGSHRSPGHRYAGAPLVAVHHFKWRPPVTADLRGRVRHHTSGAWREQTPAIRTEAARLLAHLREHGDRIDTAAPALDWRPVTLAQIPPWWPEAAARVAADFRPPHRAPDHAPGGTGQHAAPRADAS